MYLIMRWIRKMENILKSGCGIGEKCEEIYISSIFDLSFPIFLS